MLADLELGCHCPPPGNLYVLQIPVLQGKGFRIDLGVMIVKNR